MPFHWIKTDAISPNPGLWTRDRIEEVVKKHGGEVEAFLRDGDNRSVYVLAKDVQDPGGLWKDLHAKEMIELFEPDAKETREGY